jgi:hypothetical protein
MNGSVEHVHVDNWASHVLPQLYQCRGYVTPLPEVLSLEPAVVCRSVDVLWTVVCEAGAAGLPRAMITAT